MQDNELIFIHVSDIHFHPDGHGGFIGVDDDLRRQLVNDVGRFCRNLTVTGVLVTGDIAFSGTKEQYEAAQQWLTEICRKAGCDEKNVWVVPGNHDVVRNEVDASKLLRDRRERFRQINPETNPDAVDKELKDYLTDSDSKNVFLKPLSNYLDFARLYDCQISQTQVYWEKDLSLNDGSTLRLRGLTTPLISDKYDHKDKNKLVLGRFQVTCSLEPDVTYLTLAHHPPSWLLDEDAVDDYLKSRVAIQLFGHKHRQRNDKGASYIRLTAGATNPEESERDWQPRYNYLMVSVVNEKQKRLLRVRIFPRVWNDQDKEFRGEVQREGGESVEWSSPLDAWAPSTPTPVLSRHLEVTPTEVEAKAVDEYEQSFYKLAFTVRERIVRQLNLHNTTDMSLREEELFAVYCERAKQTGKLERLQQAIAQAQTI